MGCCPYPPSSLLIFGVVACLHENRLLGFTLTLKGFKILIEYCFLLSKKGKIFFVRPPAARNYLRSLHTHSGGTPDPIVYIQYNTMCVCHAPALWESVPAVYTRPSHPKEGVYNSAKQGRRPARRRHQGARGGKYGTARNERRTKTRRAARRDTACNVAQRAGYRDVRQALHDDSMQQGLQGHAAQGQGQVQPPQHTQYPPGYAHGSSGQLPYTGHDAMVERGAPTKWNGAWKHAGWQWANVWWQQHTRSHDRIPERNVRTHVRPRIERPALL